MGVFALPVQTQRINHLFLSCIKVLDSPLTVKIRTGVQEKSNIAHKLIPELKKWGVSMITVSLVKIKKINTYEEYFNSLR